MNYPQAAKINELVTSAQRIVILQADNPDGDSLGGALALEQILGDMGKEPSMYCGVDIPSYLHYLPGWDRVEKELPSQFDLSIVVDTSAESLFESLLGSGQHKILATKPCIIIDHHPVEATISFATVICNQPAVAAAEVIYELGQQLKWPLSLQTSVCIMTGIMSDSLGLTSEGTSARSIQIVSELVANGVSIAALENKRRELMRKSPELLIYKGRLLERVEYFATNRIATITIPWEEIEAYSQAYNPSMLVIDEMRGVTDVELAIAFKVYKDGKVTAKIRCNYGKAIAAELAQHFGGGGHPYASGFKVTNGKPYNEIKSECISLATELLDKLKQDDSNETLQHTHSQN